MIIRNKHESQEIGVTDKFNQVIFLKPGEKVEVEDSQGKGYLANYAHILEKLDSPKTDTDDEKDSKILSLQAQIDNLTRLIDRLTSGKAVEVTVETEKKETVSDKTEDEQKEELISYLKEKGVKGLGKQRSVEKLIAKKAEVDGAIEVDTKPEITPIVNAELNAISN